MRNAIADGLPRITVRIPGRWDGPEALRASLPAGWQLEPGGLRGPGGDRLAAAALPADAEFPRLFLAGLHGGPGRTLARRVRGYRVNLCLEGPGGSVAAARRVLDAAAAVVEAGGLGVFVDNSGRVHAADQWRALARDRDDLAVVAAFVALYTNRRRVWSLGMHVLGRRDAVMPRGDDPEADAQLLSSMLGYTLAHEAAVCDGDFVGDGARRSFRVHLGQSGLVRPGHAMHNPYGCWRLEPVGQ